MTANDLAVLERIFNPETGFAVMESQKTYYDKIPADLLSWAKQEEKRAVNLAETDPSGALDILNASIEKCPTNASAYNNRAQVLALLDRDSSQELDLAIKYGNGLPIVLGTIRWI